MLKLAKAFSEAGMAKTAATNAETAANKAGKTVKKQTIILTIADTIKMCQIKKIMILKMRIIN